MKNQKVPPAFTLLEALVLILLVAIFMGLALPMHSGVGIKGPQTKALSNAKQVGLALMVYATDHNGIFPSTTLTGTPPTPTTTPVSDSNTAFAQLFPQYLTNETIFWQAKAAECNPVPPNNIIDDPLLAVPVKTLPKGDNHWAYVLGLTDKSNPAFPLIADAFADVSAHTYATRPDVEGGLWKGTKAIVIRVDGSGSLMKVDPTTLKVFDRPSGTDLFSNSTTTWLGADNKTVNPK